MQEVTQPHNFSPTVPFSLIVNELLLKLEATNNENKGNFSSVSAKKVHIIEQFIQTWRTHIGPNIYPAVRLIFPNRDRRKFNVSGMGRLASRLLALLPELADFQILKNWKRQYLQKSLASNDKHLGDLPLIIARIILRRRDQSSPVASTVTVADVNKTLDQMTLKTKVDEQVALLSKLIDRLTIPEVRYFFLILLRESMLSFFERAFFVAWHPDAFNLYKVCDDIEYIFCTLYDPEKRLLTSDLTVKPMLKFIPQTSHKLTISYKQLCQRMAAHLDQNCDPKLREAYDADGIENHFLIEEKMDGDRMLMHMKDGKFMWHTRRRRDYTLVYGENVHVGSLTKHLALAFAPTVTSVILDGEMVAWSRDRATILPFGMLRLAAVQEALRHFDVVDVYEENNSWPFFVIFDILHLNGQDLLGLPLFYRKRLLKQIVKEVPHRFELLAWEKATSPEEIKASMKRILCDRNEGIMVKSLLSKYRVHSRDTTWIKVKPEYLENFGENLDLVVIGKIGRIKTLYMCGLKDEEDGTYKLFCLVANGFLTATYRRVEAKLCSFWRDFKSAQPQNLVFGAKKPDFWVDPANLIVLEIKARSIDVTAKTPYAAGSTLHNLWCRSVRDDKLYDECITLQEYQALRPQIDIAKAQQVNKKRKFQTLFYERSAPPPAPLHHSSVFRGVTFVVGSDMEKNGVMTTVAAMQLLIKLHGGEVCTNPRQEPNAVVLLQRRTPRVLQWVDDGFDVIRPEWAMLCVAKSTIVPLEPQFVQESRAKRLLEVVATRVDAFGDSYCTPVEGSLGSHLSNLRISHTLTPAAIRRGLAYHHVARNIFDGYNCLVLCGKGRVQAALRHCLERRIRRFGGTICSHMNCSPLIIVIVTRDLTHDADLAAQVKSVCQAVALKFEEGGAVPHVVAHGWVQCCIEHLAIVEERDWRVLV